MSRFNSNDQLMLESLVEEGFLDRLKAHGSQALGAVKSGFNMAGDMGKGDKIESYKKSARNIIQKAFHEIANDLKQLGLKIDPDRVAAFNAFAAEMQNSLNQTLDTFKQGGSTGATPPPLPAQAEDAPEEPQGEIKDISIGMDGMDNPGGWDEQPESAPTDTDTFSYMQDTVDKDSERDRYTAPDKKLGQGKILRSLKGKAQHRQRKEKERTPVANPAPESQTSKGKIREKR